MSYDDARRAYEQDPADPPSVPLTKEQRVMAQELANLLDELHLRSITIGVTRNPRNPSKPFYTVGFSSVEVYGEGIGSSPESAFSGAIGEVMQHKESNERED